MRSLVIFGLAVALAFSISVPAFAGMTKCLCDNGQVISSSRKGDRGCNSACKILGGGGRVWTPEDESYEDDDSTEVVNPPARRRGGHKRHRR